MDPAPIDPAYGAGVLLTIAAVAVAVLLVLIIKLKMHAFVALVLVSVLTAIATVPAGRRRVRDDVLLRRHPRHGRVAGGVRRR